MSKGNILNNSQREKIIYVRIWWKLYSCYKNNIKVVGITNEHGGTYNKNGLNIIQCRESQNKTN